MPEPLRLPLAALCVAALCAAAPAARAQPSVVPDSGRVVCAGRALWLPSTRAYVMPEARLRVLDPAPGATVLVEVQGGRYRGARDRVPADGLVPCDRPPDGPPPIVRPPDPPAPGASSAPPASVVAAPRGEILDLPPRPDTQPVPTQRPLPVYPDSARRSGIEGRVMLSLRVSRSGRVVDAHVVHSTNPIFDAAALEAGRRWRFAPARLRGHRVEATVTLPVVFRIEDDGPGAGRAGGRGTP